MQKINWVTATFLITTPVVALIWGGLHVTFAGIHLAPLLLAGFFVAATGLSITGGYHRLFAHGAYECSRPVKIGYLLFGAAAFQHSVLSWASDHRRHHFDLDGEEDPYSIDKGFWWAHMGWLLFERGEDDFSNVPDLVADPWIRFQHDHYIAVSVAMGFGAPLALGWMIGHPWGCLLWAGVIRIVLVHHATFLVNSLAHTLGKQRYSMAVSARDSFVTALLTFGEGYHNFHHRFATDYRNGIRAYHWDPTKWLIQTLEALGFAWDLSRVPHQRIVAAELQTELQRMADSMVDGGEQVAHFVRERVAELSTVVESAAARIDRLEKQMAEARRNFDNEGRRQIAMLRAEVRQARRELRDSRRRWERAVHEALAAPMPELV